MNNSIKHSTTPSIEKIEALKDLISEYGVGNIHKEILKTYFDFTNFIVNSDHDPKLYAFQLHTIKLLYEAFEELEMKNT